MSALRSAVAIALVVGLALGTLALLPLRWVLPALPDALRCEQAGGTLLRGFCGSAQYSGLPLGTLRWQLAPGALLLGRLSARASLDQPGLGLEADVLLRPGGALHAQRVVADAALDSPALATYTAGLRGQVRARLDSLAVDDGSIRDVRGRIEARQLVQRSPTEMPLGDYELVFGEAGAPTEPAAEPATTSGGPSAALRDLGGPLEVRGRLQLTTPAGYLLQGSVRERAGAPAPLRQQLQLLGPADAQGWRSFAQEATF